VYRSVDAGKRRRARNCERRSEGKEIRYIGERERDIQRYRKKKSKE